MFRDLNRGLLSVFLTFWWSLRHPCLETWCFERRTRLYGWRKNLQMPQTQSGWRLLPDLHNHLWGGMSLVRGWRIRGRHGRRSWSPGSLYFFPTLRLHLLHARTDASCAGLLTSSASDSSQAFWKCPKKLYEVHFCLCYEVEPSAKALFEDLLRDLLVLLTKATAEEVVTAAAQLPHAGYREG